MLVDLERAGFHPALGRRRSSPRCRCRAGCGSVSPSMKKKSSPSPYQPSETCYDALDRADVMAAAFDVGQQVVPAHHAGEFLAIHGVEVGRVVGQRRDASASRGSSRNASQGWSLSLVTVMRADLRNGIGQ